MGSLYRRAGVVLALVFVLSMILVPTVSAAPAELQNQVIYRVQPGDTLYRIAARYGISAWSIAAANGLRNWNYIYVGQALIIPYGSAPTCGPCTSTAVYYTVRSGDTLALIARRYGTTYWSLAQLNNLANPNRIYTGQVLLITPAGAGCSVTNCPPSAPPPTSGIGPWTGNYFTTPDLSGSATVVRQDSIVDFNWGWNPPAAGMPNFNWSARWVTTAYLAGGTYRANVQVDDGVRVYVDGVKVIDAWIVQATAPYQQDFMVAAGNHTITIEYFQAQGVAEMHFRLSKVG